MRCTKSCFGRMAGVVLTCVFVFCTSAASLADTITHSWQTIDNATAEWNYPIGPDEFWNQQWGPTVFGPLFYDAFVIWATGGAPPDNGLFVNPPYGGSGTWNNLQPYYAKEALHVDFLGNVTAVGGMLYAGSEDGTPIPGGAVSITLSDGQTFTYGTSNDIPGAILGRPDLGYVPWTEIFTDTPISWMEIRGVGIGNSFPTMGFFMVGTAVPESTSAIMLMWGAFPIMVLLANRRRRRA